MDTKELLDNLTKFGYILNKSIDTDTLHFNKKDHRLTGSVITFNYINNSVHYEFKQQNPKIVISGFADDLDQLYSKWIEFVALIKRASISKK